MRYSWERDERVFAWLARTPDAERRRELLGILAAIANDPYWFESDFERRTGSGALLRVVGFDRADVVVVYTVDEARKTLVLVEIVDGDETNLYGP